MAVTTVLNPTGKVAQVDGIELKVTDVIEYVPTLPPQRVQSGIIDAFWMVDRKDTRSVWAHVRNLNGDGMDIISLKNWKRYLDEGIIKN